MRKLRGDMFQWGMGMGMGGGMGGGDRKRGRVGVVEGLYRVTGEKVGKKQGNFFPH